MNVFVCNTDDYGDEPDEDASYGWDDYRATFDRIADHIEEWQGIPIPLDDHPLRLHDRHPLREVYRQIDGPPAPEIIVGGPALDTDPDTPVEELVVQAVKRSFEDEKIVNHWFCWKLNCEVYIFQRKPSGRAFAVKVPRAPDGSMDRFALWMTTLGASDAWDIDAEYKAREKLRSLLTDRQWRHYDLTGSFLETSPRSNLTYVFRRSRPTIVLTPRWPWYRRQHDQMRMLAVLCMHPIGYYEHSWAGCLVPTDDVIAHLVYMRGDEVGFWREANQHDAAAPEAGL